MKLSPSLRFPGFDADWSEMPMGDVLTFKNGYNAEASQYGSGVKFINVLDIIENNFITYDRIKGAVQIPDRDFEKNEVKYGDILFQRSSETREEVGQANVYLDREKSATFGGFVIRGRPLTKIDSRFFNSMLKTSKVRKDITSRSGGSTRYNIGQESLEDVVVSIPSKIPEQRKIADFLMAVDERIAQLSRKRALLKEYKKGVMQKIFSQEIRFKDEKGDDFPEWEENEFHKIAKRANEKHNPMNSPKVYSCVELESLSQGSGQLLQIFKSNDQRSVKNKFKVGDVLFGKLRPYLRKWLIADFEGVCSSEIWVLRGQVVTNEFLYYLVQTSKFVAATKVSSGSKMPRADWKHIAAASFRYPASNVEQSKIASFLSALDHRIEGIDNQIALTQTWKKGLLQQMFV